MNDTTTKDKKQCGKKGKVMLAYGLIQIGSSLISAIALVAIALGFCSLKNQSKVFNECVEELRESGNSASFAVRFCNGGN